MTQQDKIDRGSFLAFRKEFCAPQCHLHEKRIRTLEINAAKVAGATSALKWVLAGLIANLLAVAGIIVRMLT